MSVTNRMRIVAKNRLHSIPPNGEQKNTSGRNVWKRKEWCVGEGGGPSHLQGHQSNSNEN